MTLSLSSREAARLALMFMQLILLEEKIVSMLLQSDGNKPPVSFLSIVGIGGLGKTALAQLVFNDSRVTSAFPFKLWTCVSDQDQKVFDEKEVLRMILEAATNEKQHDATKDRLQSQLRQLLEGKKYLLVLDDVWTENREQWCKLVKFLMGGQTGSWVLVTTRSKRTGAIVGDGLMHELKGLSKEDSWRLFERVAFASELSNPSEDFVNIGKKIVEKCANVPLAIRVAGSLLYGQGIRTWLSCQELPLTKFEENESGIMPILKLSYHQLESPLKSCFAYCAIFPKDHVMAKKTLMRLWMAQGYILSGEERSMEDVAEEYFLVLLRRCFFQDVMEDEYGEIRSCKMHDLMHDVAQVVGMEICKGNSMAYIVDEKVQHISTLRTVYIFKKTCIRSFLQVDPYYVEDAKMDEVSVDALLGNCKYLRVLDLSRLGLKSLPSSIGELLHLRYLDLSFNNLEMLPRQITKLYNLQMLDLTNCLMLKELPKDMMRLVKLRVLDLRGCCRLSCMPRGMGKLSCLEELSMFVLGEANCSAQKVSNGLEDLKALTKLKGSLGIQIRNVENEGGREGGCLSNKPHLIDVFLSFGGREWEGRVEQDEAITEELQPHSNLKELSMREYQGARMPNWATEYSLPNLMMIRVEYCPNLQSLGCLGTLTHLKSLYLKKLQNLECLIEYKKTREGMGERGALCFTEDGMRFSEAHEFSFFPSLQTLILSDVPMMKGWWRGVGMGDDHQLLGLRLPKLKKLTVDNCPNLTAILECPELEDAVLLKFNLKLRIILRRKNGDEKQKLGEAITGTSSVIPKLRYIYTDNLAWFNSHHIDKEAFQCLQFLEINGDNEVENLGEFGELFCSCSSSLRSLKFHNCSKLRTISGGLEHLTNLEMLRIYNSPKLRLSEGDSVDVGGSAMPWRSLHHSLRTLALSLQQQVNLPDWMQYLTALQILQLFDCEELESLPTWMPKLTSLRELHLLRSSKGLKERCQKSTGDYWPLIQHISCIIIG